MQTLIYRSAHAAGDELPAAFDTDCCCHISWLWQEFPWFAAMRIAACFYWISAAAEMTRADLRAAAEAGFRNTGQLAANEISALLDAAEHIADQIPVPLNVDYQLTNQSDLRQPTASGDH